MPRLSKIGAAALAAFGWTSGSSVTATYLVVAGGGGGGAGTSGVVEGGGGGAGGYRTSTASLNPTLSYTVTVGAGGSSNTNGSDSIFSATTSTGGGAGGRNGTTSGSTGGSGGGAGGTTVAGANGNTPSTSPSQGNNGGTGVGIPVYASAGGGGAGAVGGTAVSAPGAGGAGTANSITGSSVTYGGGGGGTQGGTTSGAGGAGGGGAGATSGNGNPGTANLGGGGGAGSSVGNGAGGNGGSGVVIISYVGAQQFGGGVVTTDGTNTIHTFTTSGTLVPATPLTAQYLVVGGGGGGGTGVGVGGGGGAGGYRTGTGLVIDANSSYVITVGAGGASTVSGSSSAFLATTSAGGGAGGVSGNGSAGGSGGGGSAVNNSVVYTGGAGNTPSTSPSQGNNGGTGQGINGVSEAAGGGGGASAVGANHAALSVSGAGGAGTANSISGTSVTYAGGGGGGGATAGAGGAGGGGGGGTTSNRSGTAGTANTGGGGGGVNNTATAASGGSGIVIIAYPGSTQQMAGGTVTISGGNVIHTFTSSGYLTPIELVGRSLRFRASNNAYLNRTPTVAGNRKTWTWSGWVKRGTLTTAQYLFTARSGSPWGGIVFDATVTDSIQVTFTAGVSGGTYTSAFFRDPSAWYHIVAAIDTTQATAADRIKVYVNGVQITSFSSTNYPSQNFDTQFNSTIAHYLGCSQSNTENFDGYMTEVNFIDGAALTPSSFGTVNSFGVWQPITYGGSYGTNGFYLTFGNITSTTTLGYDTSPQGNNWTTNNISLTAGATYDSMLDVPTLTSATVANYATWNPLRKDNNASISLASGNLAASGTNFPSGAFMSTIAAQGSGLWYAEITFSNLTYPTIGVADITVANICPSGSMNVSGVVAWDNNSYFINGSSSASGATFASNDVLGIAFDGSTRKVWFAKNNTWISSGNPAAGTNQIGIVAGTGPLAFACRPENSVVISANFGQQGFTYTPPSGFVALNTYNLSTPTIPNGAVYMAATLYTGTSASNAIVNTVNGTSFQPDFVWLKNRNYGPGTNHVLVDSVRGTSVGLASNLTNADFSTSGNFSTINSNGFTVTGTARDYNFLTDTFVAWQWKANGAGVSNTDGTITSTVSANTTAGFSVVIWTGGGSAGTIGHGLGVTPGMIIIKNRSGTQFWFVNHASISTTQNLYLNDTAAVQSDGIFTSRGATTFGVGTGVAGSATNYVAYVFAAIAGYSAFGSYTGNGSTDGPFVFLGFRPRFIFIKSSSRVEDWHIMDTSRSTFNKIDADLYPNLSNAEAANNGTDILSNGFKLRSTDSGTNFSGATYIYMAFAENPFKYSSAR